MASRNSGASGVWESYNAGHEGDVLGIAATKLPGRLSSIPVYLFTEDGLLAFAMSALTICALPGAHVFREAFDDSQRGPDSDVSGAILIIDESTLAGNKLLLIKQLATSFVRPEIITLATPGVARRSALGGAVIPRCSGPAFIAGTLQQAAARAGMLDQHTELPKADRLTLREWEVITYIGHGLPNKIIAHRLRIAESTVKAHVSAVLMKLRLSNRTEIALFAQASFNATLAQS